MNTINFNEITDKITPFPWHWEWEDGSVLALYGPDGPDGPENHVLWTQVCKSCQERNEKNPNSSRCTAPTDINMAYIKHCANTMPKLMAALTQYFEWCRLYDAGATNDIEEVAKAKISLKNIFNDAKVVQLN